MLELCLSSLNEMFVCSFSGIIAYTEYLFLLCILTSEYVRFIARAIKRLIAINLIKNKCSVYIIYVCL